MRGRKNISIEVPKQFASAKNKDKYMTIRAKLVETDIEITYKEEQGLSSSKKRKPV